MYTENILNFLNKRNGASLSQIKKTILKTKNHSNMGRGGIKAGFEKLKNKDKERIIISNLSELLSQDKIRVISGLIYSNT